MRTIDKIKNEEAIQPAKFDFTKIDTRLTELKQLELKLLAELEKLK